MTISDETISSLLRGRVVAFTGAGLSVPSGLPTFWGSGGLYEGASAYELASPEGFAKNPKLVWDWYKARLRAGLEAKPNPGHLALVHLESISEEVIIITSNVDDLHTRAGSRNVYRLHGRIMETMCKGCGVVNEISHEQISSDELPQCACGAMLRPNVVWFGERPCQSAIEAAITGVQRASIVLEIGHSGVVSYGFTEYAVQLGKPVIRINPDPGELQSGVSVIAESADVALPRLIALCG